MKNRITALLALAINYWNETPDTISPKRNIPLAGEGERNGVWGWNELVTFVSTILRILPMQ